MIGRPKIAELWREMKVWAIRGGLCAAPSFFWAVVTGFVTPLSLLGIVLGVATCVVAYALITGSRLYRERVSSSAFGWALDAGTNTRAALAPLMVWGPDLALGLAAMTVVSRITGLMRTPFLEMRAAFPAAYLTTLVQGLLVSATVFALVLPLWGARALWLRRK